MTAEPILPIASALARLAAYPRFRYMGSKSRLAPTIGTILAELPGETVADPFCGSGIVSYLAKSIGKRVIAGDYLTFSATLAEAMVENSNVVLSASDVRRIVSSRGDGRTFVKDTFSGIFFDPADLDFVDRAWSRIERLDKYRRSIAIAALCLAAARKQPRGVFTVSGFRYDDGRRQLTTPLVDLFIEAVHNVNGAVFDNGTSSVAYCGDALAAAIDEADIIYLDPPYTPKRDDNDYIKRYHFLEGLAKYWHGETISHNTKVRKIAKRFTPFSYKRTVSAALDQLFERYRRKTIVLSYSSNAYPELDELQQLLRKHMRKVDTIIVDHRYHFGTHRNAERRLAQEYVFVCR